MSINSVRFWSNTSKSLLLRSNYRFSLPTSTTSVISRTLLSHNFKTSFTTLSHSSPSFVDQLKRMPEQSNVTNNKLTPGYITPDAKIIKVDPSLFLDNLEEHYKKANEFYESIGNPKYVCAPMVHQSELPFRMFVRKYNCQLAYTPMINAMSFNRTPKKIGTYFETCPEDRPVFAQFAGDNPEMFVRAAKQIQHEIDAADINLGCPQQIARRGHYGSFLLEETRLLQQIVRTMHDNLDIPVTVKIRMLNNDPTGEKTLALGRALQDSGASVLTLHGRTREMIKQHLGPNNFEMIRRMKATLSIPVLSNGGIETMDDIEEAIEITGVDGVMVSEALLGWPTMFAYKNHEEEPDTVDVAMELLDYHDKYPKWGHGIRPHLFKVLFKEVQTHTDVRAYLSSPKLAKDLRPVLRFLRRKQIALFNKWKSDPDAFDFAEEHRLCDIEAVHNENLQKEIDERERLAREEIGEQNNSGLTYIGTGEQAPPNPVTELSSTKNPQCFKRKSAPQLPDLTDDGEPVLLPEGCREFLKKFYSPNIPWYIRYKVKLDEERALQRELELKKEQEKNITQTITEEHKTIDNDSDGDVEPQAKKQKTQNADETVN